MQIFYLDFTKPLKEASPKILLIKSKPMQTTLASGTVNNCTENSTCKTEIVVWLKGFHGEVTQWSNCILFHELLPLMMFKSTLTKSTYNTNSEGELHA